MADSRSGKRRRRQQGGGRPAAQRRASAPSPAGAKLSGSPVRAVSWVVLVTAVVLLFTIDDRYAGAIADGRQMSWTAVAIVETGEIGQARGRDFTSPRKDGDSVSRYGMGMSLAQVPAAWLAPRIEARFGPASSQPLFLIVPLLCVSLSAAAAGRIALDLGLGRHAIAAAFLLTAVGSPLGAYAALDLSEPLQAAALTVTLASALACTNPNVERRRSVLWGVLSGFAAGVAVLTKSSLFAVVPFALLPILSGEGPLKPGLRIMALCAGLAAPLGAWVWFELSRFGRFFASYAGEGFTHPLLDGLWRLLVGPNRGFLWYFPAFAVAVAAAVVCWRSTSGRARLIVVGSFGIFSAMLVISAAWWAWHGLWGWGPRLLVPAVPALSSAAAVLLNRWPRPAVAGVVLVSVLLNGPGFFQNAAPVTMFTSSCEWPAADAAFAHSLAAYARRTGTDGRLYVAPDQVLETVPQASPFLVYPWFARATSKQDVGAVARTLTSPPWIDARPDISCRAQQSPDFTSRLKRRRGWPFWGRGFYPDPSSPGFPGVYDEGLLDQVVRALQLGRGEQALELAQKLGRLAPGGDADTYIMESLRVLGRRDDAVKYLTSLSPERRSEARINVVLALFERDAGNEQLARSLLGSVAAALPGTMVERAVSAPLDRWPRDLGAMLANGF